MALTGSQVSIATAVRAICDMMLSRLVLLSICHEVLKLRFEFIVRYRLVSEFKKEQ